MMISHFQHFNALRHYSGLTTWYGWMILVS